MNLSKLIQRLIFLTLGAFLMAVALEIFLVPNHVIDGGITGISIIFSQLTTWSLGIFLFFLNVPFLYLGYKQIGKSFTIFTLYAIIVLSLSTTFLHHTAPFTDDVLLATVFGGIIGGIGVGLVIRFGGCLDGIETLSILFSKRIPFSVGQTIMFFNLFILGSAGMVFGWDRSMYSLITYFIAFKTIDIVVEGLDESKAVWIISDHYQTIGEAILFRLGRGVTYLQGEGAYSNDSKRVLFCVITRLEESKIKTLLEEIDPDAFLAISHMSEVQGGRFKKKDIH